MIYNVCISQWPSRTFILTRITSMKGINTYIPTAELCTIYIKVIDMYPYGQLVLLLEKELICIPMANSYYFYKRNWYAIYKHPNSYYFYKRNWYTIYKHPTISIEGIYMHPTAYSYFIAPQKRTTVGIRIRNVPKFYREFSL